jgi:hypothetical protein
MPRKISVRTTRKMTRAARFTLVFSLILGLSGTANAALFDFVKKKDARPAAVIGKFFENTAQKVAKNDPLMQFIKSIDINKVIKLAKSGADSLSFVVKEAEKVQRWNTSGGAATTRTKLKRIINGLGNAERGLYNLTCITPIGLPDFSESDLQKRKDLVKQIVDFAPPVFLFAADTAFKTLIGNNWGAVMTKVNSKILPIANKIGQLCDIREAVTDPARFEIARCDIVTTPILGDVEEAQAITGHTKSLIDFVNSFVKESIVVGLSGTVGAGGGATTNIKNPVKTLLDNLSEILETTNGILGDVADERSGCFDRDDRIERDLMSCNAMMSYDTNEWLYVQDLVQRRYDDIYNAGLAQSETSWQTFEQAGSFIEVCNHYQDLRFGTE